MGPVSERKAHVAEDPRYGCPLGGPETPDTFSMSA